MQITKEGSSSPESVHPGVVYRDPGSGVFTSDVMGEYHLPFIAGDTPSYHIFPLKF